VSKRKTNRRKRPLRIKVFSALGLLKKISTNLFPIVMALTIAAAVPTGVYFSYRFVVSSEHFALSKIELSGTKRVDEAILLQQMGVFPGMNVFDIHKERAIHSAKIEPWIKNVSVKVNYPNQIVINVVEHDAVALVDFGKGLMFVDAQGTLITDADQDELLKESASAMPYISGTSGLRTEATQKVFSEGIALHAMMKGMGFENLSELNFDETLGFSAILIDGKEIRIGRDKFEKRLTRAKRVLSQDDDIAYVLVDHALESNRVIVGNKTELK